MLEFLGNHFGYVLLGAMFLWGLWTLVRPRLSLLPNRPVRKSRAYAVGLLWMAGLPLGFLATPLLEIGPDGPDPTMQRRRSALEVERKNGPAELPPKIRAEIDRLEAEKQRLAPGKDDPPLVAVRKGQRQAKLLERIGLLVKRANEEHREQVDARIRELEQENEEQRPLRQEHAVRKHRIYFALFWLVCMLVIVRLSSRTAEEPTAAPAEQSNTAGVDP
jgi:hypothetical protein